MPPSKAYPPILPRILLENLKEKYPDLFRNSEIHDQYSGDFRRAYIAGSNAASPVAEPWSDEEFLYPRAIDIMGQKVTVDGGLRTTRLHECLKRGDIAGVYELIRLGHPLDVKDNDGDTPLLCAFDYLHFKMPKECKTLPGQMLPALEEIIELLIRHHANVNVYTGPKERPHKWTPLMFAVALQNWNLFQLLLSHGADATILKGPAARLLLDSSSRKRADIRLNEHSKLHVLRPPRLCPCHSGKRIGSCHGSESARKGAMPWPSDIGCPCAAKAKTYGDCCKGRKVQFIAYWKDGRLWHNVTAGTDTLSRILTPEAKGTLEKMYALFYPDTPNPMQSSALVFANGISEERLASVQPFLTDLFKKTNIDPAYAYVLRKTGCPLMYVVTFPQVGLTEGGNALAGILRQNSPFHVPKRRSIKDIGMLL